MNEKIILHLDMDAFFASVEQAADPRLAGLPVIVGGRPGKVRTVVCAASYEAKKYGVDSGMSAQEAFRLCPGAEFVVADPAKYLYVSKKIAALLQEYSPQLEQASVDEFYLDVGGRNKIFGSYPNLGMQIKARIKKEFNITGSIGISVNRLISKIASKLKKPDGLVYLREEEIVPVLSGLPLRKIPGIGPSLAGKLNDLSLFYFSDLRKKSADFLFERFGKTGLWLYRAAHPECCGEENIGSFSEEKEQPKSVGHSYTLPNNIYTRAQIEAWLRLLCEMVAARLRRYELEASTVQIYLRSSKFDLSGKEKNFREHTNDTELIYKRALFILDRLKMPGYAIRALGVSVKNLIRESRSFLFKGQQKRQSMLKAQDNINRRFGEWTLYPASIFSLR